MIAVLLAAAYTFTATATGVEKGTPLEFMFAGEGTDRDYETMFTLDESVDALCRGLEKAGVPRGRPVDGRACRLWPVGCSLTLTPPLSEFVDSDMPPELPLGPLIYTGGVRSEKGTLLAASEMPLSAFSLYSLAMSPIVFNGIYEQGQVYGCHKAKKTLKKGEKRQFTLTWDEKPLPERVDVVVESGRSGEILKKLRDKAAKGEIEVFVTFSGDLAVSEAIQFAQALAIVDSVRVKVNGRPQDGLYFRAFLPLVRWRDRKERLTQPFEITLGDSDQIVAIDEDWSVEGLDPKLTERTISYADMTRYAKVDTAFFYVRGDEKISRLRAALVKLPPSVRNHYVFVQ